MRPVRAVDGAQVDRQRLALENRPRRGRRTPRQPQVAGEQVPCPSRHEPERNAAPDRARRDLHRGAVATVADEHIEPLGPPLLREAAGIARLGCGEHIHRPAATPQGVAERIDIAGVILRPDCIDGGIRQHVPVGFGVQ